MSPGDCYEKQILELLGAIKAGQELNNPKPGDITLFERTVLIVPPESIGEAIYKSDLGPIHLDRVGCDYRDCTLYKFFIGDSIIDTSMDQITSSNDHQAVFKPPYIAENGVKLQIHNLATGKSTISGAIDTLETLTSLPVGSTASFPDTGMVRIGDEILSYESKNDKEFLNLTRAENQTKATTHAAGDLIYNNDNVKVYSILFGGWIRPGRGGV